MQPAKTSETPVQNYGDRAISPRGILLASDGSATAIHARPMARLIAEHRQLTGSVITVLPRSLDNAIRASTPAEFDPYGQAVEPISASEKVADSIDGWAHEVVYGDAGTEIVRAADVQQSQLIILGLRRHAFVDRLFRDETALSVMQHATTPVLAIASSLNSLPQCVAVAIDFSRACITALNIAASIVRPDGRLLLVNASPRLSSQRRAPVPSTTLY
ncbi:MAG: universal stress protein, partial [Gemmatimonadaceae bacterium]